mmetsp:Transcript_64291/g.96913  ORF Transcript_64291/g.96913 Transcript_64291/m.96913 type:complete len:210 (+) Transcript_64291:830-1459(+)
MQPQNRRGSSSSPPCIQERTFELIPSQPNKARPMMVDWSAMVTLTRPVDASSTYDSTPTPHLRIPTSMSFVGKSLSRSNACNCARLTDASRIPLSVKRSWRMSLPCIVVRYIPAYSTMISSVGNASFSLRMSMAVAANSKPLPALEQILARLAFSTMTNGTPCFCNTKADTKPQGPAPTIMTGREEEEAVEDDDGGDVIVGEDIFFSAY